MHSPIAHLRPTGPSDAVIDPLLETDSWQLGFLTTNPSLLPIRSDPDLRSRIVSHRLQGDYVIAGRSALFVWGARVPDIHEIYPRAKAPPPGTRVLDVHLHYRDFVRFGSRVVTEPYRSIMDTLSVHGLTYLSDIIDLRSRISSSKLAHRCRASKIARPVWEEVVEILEVMGH